MITPVLLLLLGLVLLYFGGEALVRGSSAMALRLGMTPLVVGLTVVAFGTSAPEMVVSVNAAFAGQGDIAIGNVIGSNILNIGMILGLTAVLCPLNVQVQILRIDTPIMIGATLVVTWMLMDQKISNTEGAFLAAGIVVYTVFTVFIARKLKSPVQAEAEHALGTPKPTWSPWRDVLFIGGGLALLAGGSHYLVDGAVTLARSFGISEAVIGLTIVSLGTSMPELVTCIVAGLKKEPDIALGNIIGSNIFNLLGILGVSSIVRPLVGDGIRTTDNYVALAFAVLLLPILWSGRRLQRWEGALLVLGYGVYVALLWPR
ncbi:MAG: calcium/sodium antiporter [Planctomycetes bacterium]|nr:calcium/sodium antiporter [Planctomycetota bacterium]